MLRLTAAGLPTVVLLAVFVTSAFVFQAQAQDPVLFRADRGMNNIKSIAADGSQSYVLFGFQFIADVQIDVDGGKMYWLDQSARLIQRANLDGTGLEDLVSEPTDLNSPSGLALDLVNDKMYWIEAYESSPGDALMRANLDGTGVEELASLYQVPMITLHV